MPQLFALDTAQMPPRDRRPYIVEVFSRRIVKVDWRPGRGSDGAAYPFHARARFVAHAGVIATDFRASGGLVRRSAVDAETGEADALLITRHRTRSWYEVGGEETACDVGALTLTPSTLPFRKWTADGDDFSHRSIKLPLADLGPTMRPLVGVALIDPARAVSRLFNAYVDAFLDAAEQLTEAEAALAADVLLRLAHIALGQIDPRGDAAAAAITDARLARARVFIARHCHRPDLSPALVARHLGISVRQLHLDFEPTGTSVGRTILLARVERAKALLTQDPHRRITDVAFSAGFDGLSTFFRVFKQVTGATAGDFRVKARDRD